jgi:voltage-gated potassium channel
VYGLDAGVDLYTNYVGALYWTVSTLTSVGYGDIVPITNTQRLYAILVQLIGFGVLGYLVGKVVSIISRTDQVKARYEENIELFTTAVRRRTLPLELQKRILAYYTYLRDQKVGYDESAFLRGLPESLRTDVAISLKKEFIEGIPLFRNASEKFIVEIALKLELIVVTPGAFVFKTGDQANEMYFIISGDLEVVNADGNVITHLKEGDFFGEIALFKKRSRSAAIRAVTYCNLYKLERQTFEEVIKNHPEIAVQIEEVARTREKS